MEFHHRFGSIGKEQTRQAIDALNATGYQIFNISELGREYSFIKVAAYERHNRQDVSYAVEQI